MLDAHPIGLARSQIHEEQPIETARDGRLAVDGQQQVANGEAALGGTVGGNCRDCQSARGITAGLPSEICFTATGLDEHVDREQAEGEQRGSDREREPEEGRLTA